MKIAFYAPMKSPEAPQPSGDRTIARLLMAALSRAGWDVRLVSHLRTWSATPDNQRLNEFRSSADQQAANLVYSYTDVNADWRPDLWFTYHSYYKAPDLLGPLVAGRLGIPYAITEASYASKRATGDWSDWLSAARDSIRAADAIFSFTQRDRCGLTEICAPERLHDLAPFIDLDALPIPPVANRPAADGTTIRLVTVGMMRPGAKLASYRCLGNALTDLSEINWHIDIVGDGSARADVEAAFSGLPPGRISWHGRIDASALIPILASGDIFAWPGIEEAFGMAYLEAQASGLPVAAIRTAGVPEVVHHNITGILADTDTPQAFAACLQKMIEDPILRHRLADGARQSILLRHSLPAASRKLDAVLRPLVNPV